MIGLDFVVKSSVGSWEKCKIMSFIKFNCIRQFPHSYMQTAQWLNDTFANNFGAAIIHFVVDLLRIFPDPAELHVHSGMFIHFSHTSWEKPVSFCSVCDRRCEPNHQLLTSRETLMLSRKTLGSKRFENTLSSSRRIGEDTSHTLSTSDFLEHTWCHKAPVTGGHYIKLYIEFLLNVQNISSTQLTQLFHTEHVLYVICFTSGAPLFPWPTWRLITELYMHISSLFYSLS